MASHLTILITQPGQAQRKIILNRYKVTIFQFFSLPNLAIVSNIPPIVFWIKIFGSWRFEYSFLFLCAF